MTSGVTEIKKKPTLMFKFYSFLQHLNKKQRRDYFKNFLFKVTTKLFI